MNKIYDQLRKAGRKVAPYVPYVLAGVVVVGGYGCSTEDYLKKGTFRGYETNICTGKDDGDTRSVLIHAKDKGWIEARSGWGNQDRLFNEIKIIGISKGHDLEKYANLDSLEVAYNEILGK